jgi:hypothetical protein
VDPVTKALWAKQYRDHVDRMCLAISFDVWFNFFLVNYLNIFLCYPLRLKRCFMHIKYYFLYFWDI